MEDKEINNIKVQYYRYENIYYVNWIKGDYSYLFQDLNGELNKEEIEILVNEKIFD